MYVTHSQEPKGIQWATSQTLYFAGSLVHLLFVLSLGKEQFQLKGLDLGTYFISMI